MRLLTAKAPRNKGRPIFPGRCPVHRGKGKTHFSAALLFRKHQIVQSGLDLLFFIHLDKKWGFLFNRDSGKLTETFFDEYKTMAENPMTSYNIHPIMAGTKIFDRTETDERRFK